MDGDELLGGAVEPTPAQDDRVDRSATARVVSFMQEVMARVRLPHQGTIPTFVYLLEGEHRSEHSVSAGSLLTEVIREKVQRIDWLTCAVCVAPSDNDGTLMLTVTVCVPTRKLSLLRVGLTIEETRRALRVRRRLGPPVDLRPVPSYLSNMVAAKPVTPQPAAPKPVQTRRYDDFADRLDSFGLWEGLDEQSRAANRERVALGEHPFATDGGCFEWFGVDGEAMAESGVEEFLETLIPVVARYGVTLEFSTARDSLEEGYAVIMNGVEVEMWAPQAWEYPGNDSHPWETASRRPLGRLNQLLAGAGTAVRFHFDESAGDAYLFDSKLHDAVRGIPHRRSQRLPTLIDPGKTPLS
jgi:hypothetical protein